MGKYFLKRLLLIIPTFFLITFVVFGMLSIIPGNPAESILGIYATQEQVEALTEELGLNQPFLIRYVDYIVDLLRGDLGVSWLQGYQISDQVVVRLPNSLLLAFCAVFLTVIVGIPVGVYSAAKQYKLPDKISLILSLVFACIPAFWLALIAQLLFSVKLGWLPALAKAEDWKSMILPVFTLSASAIANTVRTTRASMLDVLGQDYIRTARAKGSSRVHVILRHALPNALLPVVTGIGSSFSSVFSGAVIIEIVFSYQGIGSLLITAVRGRDVPVVMGTVIFVALVICALNLAVDLSYACIDPRVRQRFSKS